MIFLSHNYNFSSQNCEFIQNPAIAGYICEFISWADISQFSIFFSELSGYVSYILKLYSNSDF